MVDLPEFEISRCRDNESMLFVTLGTADQTSADTEFIRHFKQHGAFEVTKDKLWGTKFVVPSNEFREFCVTHDIIFKIYNLYGTGVQLQIWHWTDEQAIALKLAGYTMYRLADDRYRKM